MSTYKLTIGSKWQKIYLGSVLSIFLQQQKIKPVQQQDKRRSTQEKKSRESMLPYLKFQRQFEIF